MTKERLLLTTAMLLSMSTGAYAQTAVDAPVATTDQSGPGLGEIVVTAQRREERMQDVPIAVASISADQLAAQGLTSILDIRTAVPGVNVRQAGGIQIPYIRGVGSAGRGPLAEPPIALYIDGVYMPTQTSILTFNNVSNIEVLKGPQGTLFGRNATGGLIQVTTRKPSYDLTGDFSASYGNYDSYAGQAYISGGLTDKIAMDLAFTGSAQGNGYGKNLYSGKDVYKNDHNIAVRSKLLFDPSDDTEITFIADYNNYRNTLSSVNTFLPGTFLSPGVPAPVQAHKYDVDDNVEPVTDFHGGGVSAHLVHDLGSVSLSLITAYRQSHWFSSLDLDALPLDIQALPDITQYDRHFTQELTLQSEGGGPFKWTAGAFYYHGYSAYDPNTIDLGTVDRSTYSYLTATSMSVYGEGSYKFSEGTRLTLGARYTYEKRGISARIDTVPDVGPVITGATGKAHSHIGKPTFRVVLDQKITPNIMVYASFNTGIKSGGYNQALPSEPPFKPEKLTAYEVGVKTELWDKRIRLNMSGFYYDYADHQVQVITALGTVLRNGDAELYGFDADLATKITSNLTFNTGLELLHANYTNFPDASIGTVNGGDGVTIASAAGKRMPYTPKVAANAGFAHEVSVAGGTLRSTLVVYYASRTYAQADNITSQAPYAQLNASVEWTSAGGLSAKLWMNNITNKIILQNATNSGPTGRRLANYEAPRLYGVTVGYKF